MTPGLVGRDSATLLSAFAYSVPPDQAIVEVGVFMARTTLFLAAGAAEGLGAHVYGVDPWDLPGERYPYQWLNQPGKPNRKMFTLTSTRQDAERLVAESGLGITLIRGFSVEVAATWTIPIGLLFIDADHRPEAVRADWEAWSPHLASGAHIVWDDYHPGFPGVMEVVDELIAAGQVKTPRVFPRKNSAMLLTRV